MAHELRHEDKDRSIPAAKGEEKPDLEPDWAMLYESAHETGADRCR